MMKPASIASVPRKTRIIVMMMPAEKFMFLAKACSMRASDGVCGTEFSTITMPRSKMKASSATGPSKPGFTRGSARGSKRSTPHAR